MNRLKDFYNDNETGGSSRWLVSPDTVERYVHQLIKEERQTIVDVLIERFDDLEEETGADFKNAKRVILRWASKHNLFN